MLQIAKKLFAGGRLEIAVERVSSTDKTASINKKLAFLEAINVLKKPVSSEMADPIPAPYEPARQTKYPRAHFSCVVSKAHSHFVLLCRDGIVEVFCAVLGHAGVFPIEIDALESVGDLKDAIKEQKRHLVRCDADQLQLFRGKRKGSSWLSPDDLKDQDAKLLMEGKTSKCIHALLMQDEMDATFAIGDYLDVNAPTRRVIHVLIRLPQSVEGKARNSKPAVSAVVVVEAVSTAEDMTLLTLSDGLKNTSAEAERADDMLTIFTSPDTESVSAQEAPPAAAARRRHAKKNWSKKRKKN